MQTTHWTKVLQAAQGDSIESKRALEEICEAYWDPLYSYARRRGYSAEDARELTQAYFTTLIEKQYLRSARPARGRFRSFLLTSFRNFLSNERDRETALKRGGGIRPVSLDSAGSDSRPLMEPRDPTSPEKCFEKNWALTVVDRTMRHLEQEFRSRGKLDHFHSIKHHLTGTRPKDSYRKIAVDLGTTEGAIKSEVLRTRRRFGQVLRGVIGETVSSPDEVDDEIHFLIRVLSD